MTVQPPDSRDSARSTKHLAKFGLVQHADAKFLRFLQFAAGLLAREHESSFFCSRCR